MNPRIDDIVRFLTVTILNKLGIESTKVDPPITSLPIIEFLTHLPPPVECIWKNLGRPMQWPFQDNDVIT